jgi:hypothetical protein
MKKVKPFHYVIFAAIILTALFGESIITHLVDMAFLNLKEFFIFLGILVCFIFYIRYRLKNK